LNFFNTIRGPQILCYYPDTLEENLAQQIANLLNISELLKQKFFVYETSPQFKTVNYYFEIPSEWARGKKEFAMLSLIMKIEYKSEDLYTFLVDSSYKILKTENVYKAFYKFDDFHNDDFEIDLNYETSNTGE